MNLRPWVWVLAVALGTGITAGTVRASSSSQEQAQTQDYSKNKNYNVGVRDGKDYKAHNKDPRKRNFKKDDDQKAYEAGYQQGHR